MVLSEALTDFHLVNKLSESKAICSNPFRLKKQLKSFKGYRYQRVYLFQLFTRFADKLLYPISSHIVKTKPMLDRLLDFANKKDFVLLYLPNPVMIPDGFWSSYKNAKTQNQKNELIESFGLLKDENIFAIERIIVDIDSDFDLVYPFWRFLEIEADIYKTKSNRFRAIIHFEPFCVDDKCFYLRPNTKHINGKTHRENLLDMLKILYKFFKHYNINFDSSFFRINHPVILENQDIGNGYRLIEEAKNRIKFYSLYKYLKTKQKEWQLFDKEKKEHIVKVPIFMRDKLKGQSVLSFESYYELSVETLTKAHVNKRFIHVMLPAVGWAKFLGFSEEYTMDILKRYIGDKKDFDKDFKKAWRYAKELPFGCADFQKEYDNTIDQTYESYSVEVLKVLNKSQKTRQALLKELFHNQKWLCDAVLNFLSSKGYIESVMQKQIQKGRPSKVLFITEEGKEFLEDLDKPKPKYNLPTKEEILTYYNIYHNNFD